tara:strand:- start:9 stop:605 length:597 start_codon:yes stop_codon:yes gene_type:complete
MKAIPTTHKGIDFRSKLEARWYIFMKSLGWNIEYEPHIEGLNGWLPDFLIIGNGTKILVEVKPFNTLKDFTSQYSREATDKIENSKFYKIKNIDAVILVGASLNLSIASCSDGNAFIGGRIFHPHSPNEYDSREYYEDSFVYINGLDRFKIGICDEECDFKDMINKVHDGTYYLSEENKDFIEICWNKAGSKLQWKPR